MTRKPVSLVRTQTFLVTHVFHPLYGRELRLIDEYLAWGEDRVCFRDDKGALRFLPTAWTTLAPPDPFVQMSAGRSHFRVEDLLRLTTLIAQQTPAQRSSHGAAGVDLRKLNCVPIVK